MRAVLTRRPIPRLPLVPRGPARPPRELARALLPLVLLAACVTTPPASETALRAAQEAACAATIAAHVRRPVAEVTPRWLSASGGVATVEARDGDRIHLCQVDGAARVLGYEHPGA